MFRSLLLALCIAAFAAPAGAKGSSSRSFSFSKPSRPTSAPSSSSKPVRPASSPFQASKPVRATGSPFQASKPVRATGSPFQVSKPVGSMSAASKPGKPVRATGSLFKPSKPKTSRKPFALLKSSTTLKPVKSRTSAAVTPPTAASSEAKSRTVYITDTGKKYHAVGCSSLRKSRIPISLKQAIARGYEACSRCRG